MFYAKPKMVLRKSKLQMLIQILWSDFKRIRKLTVKNASLLLKEFFLQVYPWWLKIDWKMWFYSIVRKLEETYICRHIIIQLRPLCYQYTVSITMAISTVVNTLLGQVTDSHLNKIITLNVFTNLSCAHNTYNIKEAKQHFNVIYLPVP